MDQNHLDFLKNYQKTLFSAKSETVSEKAAIQRKCLTQTYNYSLSTLDEKSVCYLLEKNLNKYYETLDKDTTKSTFMTNDRVKKALEDLNIPTPVNLDSNLSNIDLKSILKPLPCYETNNYTCTASETISDTDFNNFLKSFHKTRPPPQFPPKTRNLPARTKSEEAPAKAASFKTARDELLAQKNPPVAPKRKLGLRRTVNSKFVPPLLSNGSSGEEASKSEEWGGEVDERLKNIDPKMVELIKSEIMDVGTSVAWDDIAGLEFAKTAIQEAVVWPLLRPDIFRGLRRPPKGILLFGPPGTGKTLIGKCVASQSKSTFFSISASSLTSKWVGEGEKMVRALFAVARCHQPAVIFIDEIDSLLTQRSENEHESSRRIKTEFLVQLDGANVDGEERLLVIGATNRPQELDEAARRRFVKRLYIPLPEFKARLELVEKLISKERNNLEEADFSEIARLSDGYSGADIRNLCSEACLGPIRSIDMRLIEKIRAEEVRPVIMDDFHKAFARVRSSVSPRDLEQYVVWDQTYGSGL